MTRSREESTESDDGRSVGWKERMTSSATLPDAAAASCQLVRDGRRLTASPAVHKQTFMTERRWSGGAVDREGSDAVGRRGGRLDLVPKWRHSSTAENENESNNGGRTDGGGTGDLCQGPEAREDYDKRRRRRGNQEEQKAVTNNHQNQTGQSQDSRTMCRCCGKRVVTSRNGGRGGGGGGGGVARDLSHIQSDINAGGSAVSTGCLWRNRVRTEEAAAVRAERGGGGGNVRQQPTTNIAQHGQRRRQQQQQEQEVQQQQRAGQQRKAILAAAAAAPATTTKNVVGGRPRCGREVDGRRAKVRAACMCGDSSDDGSESWSPSPSLSQAKTAWLPGMTSISYHASVLESSKRLKHWPPPLPNRGPDADDDDSSQAAAAAVHNSRSCHDWSPAAAAAEAARASRGDARGAAAAAVAAAGGSRSNLSTISGATSCCLTNRTCTDSYAEQLRRRRRRRSCLLQGQQQDNSSNSSSSVGGHHVSRGPANDRTSSATTGSRNKLRPAAAIAQKQFSKSLQTQSLHAVSGRAFLHHKLGDTANESVRPPCGVEESICLKGVGTMPRSRRLQSHGESIWTESHGSQWKKEPQPKPADTTRPSAFPRCIKFIKATSALQGAETRRPVGRRPVTRDHLDHGAAAEIKEERSWQSK